MRHLGIPLGPQSRLRLGALAILWWVGAGLSGLAGADIESLLSPGPLAKAHQELTEDCSSCHVPFQQDRQLALCLSCHEEVSGDRAAGQGLHGRLPSIRARDCRGCHAEHRGELADLGGLDADTFDHAQTDFVLAGRHSSVACISCHEPASPRRDASSKCVDCHNEDDRHRGRLGTECAKCHSVAGWADVTFDHDSTGFELVGEHRTTPCALCHPSERYKKTSPDCTSCHALSDIHRGRLGTDCAQCHRPGAWDRTDFDHGRDTPFALEGRHKKVVCGACHQGDPYTDRMGGECASCHAADDHHRGRNGSKCGACHSAVSWRETSFDHLERSGFGLRGAHQQLACARCHLAAVDEEELRPDCAACHEEDDAHSGQEEGDCGDCHSEVSWTENVRFDHSLARFPLLGLHGVVACDECHLTQKFKDAPETCEACHAQVDSHEGRLGGDCARCHTPNGWSVWRFDHDSESSFALHGAHDDLDCLACHRSSAQGGAVSAPTKCQSCHRRDDVHRGRFGRVCADCHEEESWSGALPKR